jgi:type I restriction enzyme M protein
MDGKDANQEGFDVVLSNPPYGLAVDYGALPHGPWALAGLVGRDDDEPAPAGKARKAPKRVKSEILFLEQAWRSLKPGGRATLVVPDGVLGSQSLTGVRKWLMHQFQLLAVISVPPETFQAAGTNTKTSLLVLRKRRSSEVPDDGEMVFMAIAKNIGRDSRGRPTYKVAVQSESPSRRVEIHRTDLFDTEVTFLPQAAKKGTEWVESGRLLLPETGLLGQFRAFERDPHSLEPTPARAV